VRDAVAGEQISCPGSEFAELAEYLPSAAGAESAAAYVFDLGLDEDGGVFCGAPVVHDREDVAGAEAFEHDVVPDTAVGGTPGGDEAVAVADDLGEVGGICCQAGVLGEFLTPENLVASVALAADEIPGAAVDGWHEGDVAALACRAGDREEMVDVVPLGESAAVAVLADPPVDRAGPDVLVGGDGEVPDVGAGAEGEFALGFQAGQQVAEPAAVVVELPAVGPVAR